ncbi:MAG: hypothetical protein J3R72DRAFT_489162 [Linnemannia gamsii]|nr:MAG: hypothetical protein J3R72DRAFT_489162 [Linnemannia gamsii]
MSMTPRSTTSQMPFDFSIPIDPGFHKVLQSKIRTLLHSKAEGQGNSTSGVLLKTIRQSRSIQCGHGAAFDGDKHGWTNIKMKKYRARRDSGFPGSYPVNFDPSHLQQLASEEYFALEKFASVRCMLLSTNTPKGPACFLIDRHNEISFVPHLHLPLRDNPSKYQNDTLLDGEMVTEHDGHKTTLRFLVFDLMILNGVDVTQRSYSSRLGMLDQEILGVHASKSGDTKAKEPFTIERKTMQRSYGMNVILSGSRKQKQGAEGLIFVPVKQPYIAGTNPKLLKWKSHTTAQFQIKVTLSKERKPLYCIHFKQGTSSKFYDYVTPDSVQSAEWHTTSPDGKIAEFWWDAQWPTQMFEKGYGLETRTGGWRFNRVREDRKDVDEESTILALVKSLETLVTKEQLESNIDHIRRQWKAREAGVVPNGTNAPSSAPTQRPPMRPLSITNSTSHPDGQALLTPAISSHYLQSPSVASHSSSQGYFSRKDRERKASVDEFGSSSSLPTSISGTFSHPLPPKPPPYQPRQSSMDQSQPCSPNPPGAGAKNSEQEEQTASPSSIPSSSAQSTQNSEGKLTPPTTFQPTTTTATLTATATATAAPTPNAASNATTTSVVTATPTTTVTPTTTATSTASGTATTSPTNLTRNPLKLSQVQAHLQPIKSWMTVAPVPRAPLGDKAAKLGAERRDSRDTSSLDTPQRPNAPSSRKSSVVSTDGAKDAKDFKDGKDVKSIKDSKDAKDATATTSASTRSQESKSSASINTAPSNSSASASQDRPPQTPQTPTPAQTPTIAGTSRSAGTSTLPTPVSFTLPNIALPNVALPNIALPNIALPNIALPNTQHRDTDEKAVQDTESEATSSAQSSDTSGPHPFMTSPTVKPMRNPSVADISSSKPSPVLGKRTVASSSSAGERQDDSLAQRRKLSDAMQPSPKSEAVMTGIGSLNIASTLSPKSASMTSFPPEGAERGSPLLSPLGSPSVSTKPTDHQQPWPRSQQSSGSRTLKTSNLAHEVPPYASQGPVDRDITMAEVKGETDEPTFRLRQDGRHGESKNIVSRGDVEMEDVVAPKVEQGDVFNTPASRPPPRQMPAPDVLLKENVVNTKFQLPGSAPAPSQPPTPAFVMAAQGAYEVYDNQDKARAMAMARAAASSKLDEQLELQLTKEKKLLEDIEKFKESSRTKKEKSVKQRTRDVIEAPVQDRRAQPVRQINQQQGRQSNPDSPALRSQSQLGQRVGSSPQEQQRLAYATRQSRSNPRADPTQNAPVNSKPQHRPEQQPVLIEQIDPTGGQVPKEQVHREHFPAGDRPDSREQMDMLRADDAPRQHRRINSMDNRFQQSRPSSPSRFDSSIPQQQHHHQHHHQNQQQAIPDGRYGQPHSKRLDLGQHGDPKHRRSHSDVGIFYKPIATAIVAPQPIARPPQGSVQMEVVPSPQAPPLGQPGVEYRQNGQRPSPTGPRPEMDESWMKHGNNSNNSNGSFSGREAPPVKESKARLQFILNDDPTSPEGDRRDDDPMERPQGPEAPDWDRRNPEAELVQRMHAPHMAYPDQPHLPNDYVIQDPQETRLAPPQAPPSMASANLTRRQPSKKQKLSQDSTGQDPAFNSSAEEYEYHMRQSQLHPQARPPSHSSQQRSSFPADRWPQQGQAQQHPPQPPLAMQGQPQPLAGPPPAGGRRVGGEGPAVGHQSSNHHFPGPEIPQHGPSMGRPPHPDQYGPHVHGSIMEGSRPKPERLSHSRHSSVSKAGPGLEQVQQQGPTHPGARTKGGLPHGSGPVVEQYPRGYPQPPLGAVPGQSRPAPPSQHQPPYQPSPQQQPQPNSVISRKKAAAEQQQQPGPYGPPPPVGAPAGYEQRPNVPQNAHTHQQQQQQQHQQQQQQQQAMQHQQQQQQIHQQQLQHQHHQHAHGGRHQEQDVVHEEPAPGLYKQPQGSVQVRGSQQDLPSGHPGQGYYEQDPQYGPSRSAAAFGSQTLHPSSAQERQSASHGPYHPSTGPHDPSYRSFPGGGGPMRSSVSSEHLQGEEHMRPSSGGRGSMSHLPPEHGSQQSMQAQHAPPSHPSHPSHPSQRSHPSHPQYGGAHHQQQQQQAPPNDYRHGHPQYYHSQQVPAHQQHPSQQKMMHDQELHHAMYPPHHNGGPKIPSPRPGQPGGHPADHDPNYRPQAPHGHGGPSW